MHQSDGTASEDRVLPMPGHDEDRKVVSAAEWLKARRGLQVHEDKFLDDMQALNAERRQLPMVQFDTDCSFIGSDTTRSLLDLFDGRSQLIVYHFWFEPGEQPCAGCSLWTSDLGDLSNVHDRDTSLVFVSSASIDEIDAAKRERGWTMPWYSLDGDGFNAATGYADVAQLSMFARDEDFVFLTYVTREGRDLETISNHWALLERTPFGPG